MIDHDQVEVLSYLTDEGLAIRAEVERVIAAATLLAEIERRRTRIGLQPSIAVNSDCPPMEQAPGGYHYT
jgi:hypothetical protein